MMQAMYWGFNLTISCHSHKSPVNSALLLKLSNIIYLESGFINSALGCNNFNYKICTYDTPI